MLGGGRMCHSENKFCSNEEAKRKEQETEVTFHFISQNTIK